MTFPKHSSSDSTTKSNSDEWIFVEICAASESLIRTVHRFGYAFREAVPRGDVGPSARRGSDVSFRLKWKDRRVTLEEGEHVIGRDPDVEIFLNSAGVSRHHARIRISGGRATIEDLGSKNGTFVRDQRVEGPTLINDGDIIGVGALKLSLRIVQTPKSTRTERGERQFR
jgi:hypothetical protein